MKCKMCGANIGLEVTKCPYCGTVNEEAVKKEGFLNFLQSKNQELMQKIRKQSSPVLIYRVLKRLKWMMVLGCLVLTIGYVLFAFTQEQAMRGRAKGKDLKNYYQEANLEELYFTMNRGDFFDVEEYQAYSGIAFVWRDYNEVQISFAEAYQYFLENGVYREWNLERCIEKGCKILTANTANKYYRFDLSEKDMKLIKPYQDEIKMLFTGVFQIPEEMLVDLDQHDHKKIDEITEYIFSVLPTEDN